MPSVNPASTRPRTNRTHHNHQIPAEITNVIVEFRCLTWRVARRDHAASWDAAGATGRAKMDSLATALRRAEALWISNKSPVTGAVVAFHDPEYVDETLVPVFMLPSLPQRSTDFIELAGMMDPRQPFFALYMPSEKRHAETASTVAILAQYYASEIHKSWPTGPIAVGGWSTGVTVALAATSELRALGHAVPLLVVIDGAPPSVDIGRPTRFQKTRLTYFRLTNATASLAKLGCDLVRRMRHRPLQNHSLRDCFRSAWRDSAFRPIWQRATTAIAGKVARVWGKHLVRRHPAESIGNIPDLPARAASRLCRGALRCGWRLCT